MPARPVTPVPFLRQPLHISYFILFAIFWAYTGLTTPDLVNWVTENMLTLSLLIILAAFYNIFRFSDLSYTLLFLFLLLHVYGTQYQYAENPFGEWLKATYGFTRNHYDRLVHTGFGLLLAYPMHEVLRRAFKVKPLVSYLLPIEITLSLGGLYEVAEWLVADVVHRGDAQGMAYLGAQGDVWDAQKDLALALAGAAFTMGITYLLRKRNQGISQDKKKPAIPQGMTG